MSPRLWAAAALAFFAAPVAAQKAPPPKLVVVIAVDQLSSALFEQYREHFSGGLRRLGEGAVFPFGYQAHNATETCPGHATILTGSRPARTGIIANSWFDLSAAREDKAIYCAEDERVPGSTSRNYTVSSYHLRVPTLGDRLKRLSPESRVVAVAGKDRSAVMMAGHEADQLWYWSGSSFIGKGDPAPAASVSTVNMAIASMLVRPRDPLDLPPLCEARARPVAVPGREKPVGEGRFARAASDVNAFRASPESDGATLALAAALQQEMRLGQKDATDLLILGLSATDYVGHGYGTQGSEMCLQLLALDRSLGDFFERLDASGVDYLVALTSDHGGDDLPERNRERGMKEAARIDLALAPSRMGEAIGRKLGIGGSILFGDAPMGDIYVDRALAPAQRQRVLNEAVRAYRSHPQVAQVFTGSQLRAAPNPSGPPDKWSLLDRARASFDPERSGDLVVLLKPRISPIANASRGSVATHGSPWDYDRRVPILFWRKGMRPSEHRGAVEVADILPTLAPLIGVELPAGAVDGRCLDLDAGAGSSCR